MREMHIAMIGLRGIPATFGGVERHVEEIGARLADRGHKVDVYCRPDYAPEAPAIYRGMNRIDVAAINTPHLEAFSHSAIATAAAAKNGADIFHFHAIGPGLWSFIPRAVRRKAAVVQTIHGLDFDREKWSPPVRKILSGGATATAKVPHLTVVVSKQLTEEYAERYGRDTTYIPNGVGEPNFVAPGPALEAHGLQKNGYALFVGRLVPEKAVLPMVKAFLSLDTDQKLVIAGGSSHTDEYAQQVIDLANTSDRVVMPGYVYGEELHELYSNASAFILPSELEGLPLTLLEALSYKLPIVASDLPAHTQVLHESAPGTRIFASGDWDGLADQMTKVFANLETEQLGAQGHEQLLEPYDWDKVTDQLEACYDRQLSRLAR